jgi:hypothetical protein
MVIRTHGVSAVKRAAGEVGCESRAEYRFRLEGRDAVTSLHVLCQAG